MNINQLTVDFPKFRRNFEIDRFNKMGPNVDYYVISLIIHMKHPSVKARFIYKITYYGEPVVGITICSL